MNEIYVKGGNNVARKRGGEKNYELPPVAKIGNGKQNNKQQHKKGNKKTHSVFSIIHLNVIGVLFTVRIT